MSAVMKLQGRTALVTGASQGLGAVMAKTLAAAGCRVIINCARQREKAQAVADEIAAAGGTASVAVADVSSADGVGALFAALGDGGPDILVNNARVDPYKRPQEMDDAAWFDRVMGVNLKGPYLCSLAAIERMKRKGWGRIINVSSVWAYRAATRPMLEYAMSKAAMHSLTRSLALIAAPFGITVNTLAPGLILTEELDSRITPARLAEMTAGIPVGRGASMEEVAGALWFALDNGYVTGETININGGVYMP